jgi:muramidase (phage lysozyme)
VDSVLADLPEVPLREDIVSKTPTIPISPGQIASPYQALAHVQAQTGEALEKISVPLAEQAGYEALKNMSYDADGNPQVSRMPMFGPALTAYSNTIKMGALAEADRAARMGEIELREKYRDDPKGFLEAHTAFSKKLQEQFGAISPEVGIAARKTAEQAGMYTYRGLRDTQETLQLHNSKSSIEAGIKSAHDDLMVMAARGVPIDDPAYTEQLGKIESLIDSKTKIPRLGYSEDQAKYDKEQLLGDIGGSRLAFEVRDIYQKEGKEAAFKHANEILTNPSLKLSPEERYKYFHRSKSEIAVAESLKREDVKEIRDNWNEIKTRSREGYKTDPQVIQNSIEAANKLGMRSLAAGIERDAIHIPLLGGLENQNYRDRATSINRAGQWRPRTDMGVEMNALAATIVGGESSGNYAELYRGNSVFDHNPNYDWKDHPHIGQRIVTGPNAGNFSEATGPFQITGGTWRQDKAKWNLKDFTPETQDQWFKLKAQERWEEGIRLGKLAGVKDLTGDLATDLKNHKDEPGFLLKVGHAMSGEWTSAPGGLEHNKMTDSWEDRFRNNLGRFTKAQDPSTPDWLVANQRASLKTDLKREEQQSWEEFSKSGIRPTKDKMDQFFAGARATQDSVLFSSLEQHNHVYETVDAVAGRPLVEQQYLINEAKANANKAGVDEIGQGILIKGMQQKHDEIERAAQDDAPATYARVFSNQTKLPEPLDFNDPVKLTAQIKHRERLAGAANATWGSGPYSAIGKDEIDKLQAGIEQERDPKKVAALLGILTHTISDEGIRNATFAKIGAKNLDTSVSAWAGGMFKEDNMTAGSILNGRSAYQTDKRLFPPEAKAGIPGATQEWNEAMDKKLPASVFPTADRADPKGNYATIKKAIEYQYIHLSDMANHDVSGIIDQNRLDRAVSDVTGGVLYKNGGYFITPERGMSQYKFDNLIYGITESDLVGVTMASGRQVTVDDVRNNARFESHGEGQYLLNFSGGTDLTKTQPAYAHKYGKPYVIDMRIINAPKQAPMTTPDAQDWPSGMQFTSGYQPSGERERVTAEEVRATNIEDRRGQPEPVGPFKPDRDEIMRALRLGQRREDIAKGSVLSRAAGYEDIGKNLPPAEVQTKTNGGGPAMEGWSDEELKDMGYTKEQIEAFKKKKP